MKSLYDTLHLGSRVSHYQYVCTVHTVILGASNFYESISLHCTTTSEFWGISLPFNQVSVVTAATTTTEIQLHIYPNFILRFIYDLGNILMNQILWNGTSVLYD